MRTTRALLLPAVLAAALSLSACGDGPDEAADDDVATLGGDPLARDDAPGGAGGGTGSRAGNELFQDAALEFAQCMREHGIDMPDPEFTGDGGVIAIGRAGDGGSQPSIEEMEAADEACGHIMEEVRSELPPPDPEEMERMREQTLEFAECMREHGIDFPDPVFDGEGRVSISLGGGQGVAPDDEDLREASEACGDEGGFGFRPGAPIGTTRNDG